MLPRARATAFLVAACVAWLPVRAHPAPEPWRPDDAFGPPAGGVFEEPGATRPAEDAPPLERVVPAAFTPRSRPSLSEAILALPVVEEHRDDAGRLVRLARDPSGATVRYAIGADGRIADLEVWPAAKP